jgi:hypothetical protein
MLAAGLQPEVSSQGERRFEPHEATDYKVKMPPVPLWQEPVIREVLELI